MGGFVPSNPLKGRIGAWVVGIITLKVFEIAHWSFQALLLKRKENPLATL
jgi:hypothetical protein